MSTTLNRWWTGTIPAWRAACSSAARCSPPGARKRVVLLSDGRENLGDAVAEAHLLREAGIRVDVARIGGTPGPEVRVDALEVPANLHIGERFALTVRLTSTVRTATTLQILEDGSLVRSERLDVRPGEAALSYTLLSRTAGIHRYKAVIQPAVDTLGQNNEASAIAAVAGPPRVLVAEGYPGAGANAVAALRAAKIDTAVLPGYAVPTDLPTLQRYAGVVLADVPADELGQEAMGALRQFVGDLGHGLVALGGANSFGVGNYGHTPLEEALPVRMDLPKRKDLPTAAVVLIVESLESQDKVNISKQAAKGVVGLLNPSDQIAISDAQSGMVVPLQYVADKSKIDAAIDAMQPGDPGSYTPYLHDALLALKGTTAQTKHIILLGDGDAQDNYRPLLQQITAAGIAVSTIETNASAQSDFATMRDIARWGKGKYYPADNVSSIPRVFVTVAKAVAHSSLIEDTFYPAQDAPSPIMAGIDAVPALHGYVVTTPKPLSTIVLASPKSDPILAQWQYGLGRAVAWTSDSQGRWSADWLANPATRRIWSAMVNWVLPPPQSERLLLSASSSGGIATVGVDSTDGAAYRQVTARVVGPGGASTVTLQPTAPNHYEAQFPTGSEGAYMLDVQARLAGTGAVRGVSGGLVVPYAPDYRDSGPDDARLAAIAQAGGGAVLTGPRASFADNLPSVAAPASLQLPLLLLALLLLPLDVAARRLVLEREDWMALLATVTRRSGATGPAQPVSAPLAAIRGRRQARHAAPPTSGSTTEPISNGAPAALPPPKQAPVRGSGEVRQAPASSPTPAPSGAATLEGPPSVPTQTPARAAPPERTQAPGTPLGTADTDGRDSSSRLLEAKRRRRSG